MNNIYKSLLSAIAVLLMLGLVGCSTTKHEPAPAAPEPMMDPKPDRS